MRSLMIVGLWLLFCGATVGQADNDDSHRFLAVFANGEVVTGSSLTHWNQPNANVQLSGKSLLDNNRPARWLLDRKLEAAGDEQWAAGYVEMVGGDRLMGAVTSAQPAPPNVYSDSGTYLVVKPAKGIDFPAYGQRESVRVVADAVRKVVWDGPDQRPFQAATVFFRDGRRQSFRGIRWGETSAQILTDAGPLKVFYGEMSAVHLPHRDPWELFYRELAGLVADNAKPLSRLIRAETTGGVIATTSLDLFRVDNHGDARHEQAWHHVFCPAWSPDPLWLAHSEIRSRLIFEPHEVPLCRLAPTHWSHRSLVGEGWSWRRDRNVLGGPLTLGERPCGWGFGVHGQSQLVFELPPLARAFRTFVGLDQSVGEGGCAQATVDLRSKGSSAGRPKSEEIFRSKIMVGANQFADTEWIPLPANIVSESGCELVLATDAVLQGRPQGADPFDIRDHINWAEPIVQLEADALALAVQPYVPLNIPGWHGWEPRSPTGVLPLVARWDTSERIRPRYVYDVHPGKHSVSLSKSMEIREKDRFLRLVVRQADGSFTQGEIEFRFEGRPIARAQVPKLGDERPLLLPLGSFTGKTGKMEVVVTPKSEKEKLAWLETQVTPQRTRVQWLPLKPLEVTSPVDTVLTILDDGSILAGGPSNAIDTYRVVAQTDLRSITGLRIEALPHATLPGRGPGRHPAGLFILNKVRLETPLAQPGRFKGRHVRVELPTNANDPKDLATLSLAEVRVLRGQENLALDGNAKQSSTYSRGRSSRAIDGRPDTQFGSGSVAQTQAEANPWWEVDLGRVHEFDQIEVTGRTEPVPVTWLRNFRVQVLGDDRGVAWQRDVAFPPAPSRTLTPNQGPRARFSRIDASYLAGGTDLAGMLAPFDQPKQGWSNRNLYGQAQVLVLTLRQPLRPRQSQVAVELVHLFGNEVATLGRFRLWVTSDLPPLQAEPPGIDVSLLPAASE